MEVGSKVEFCEECGLFDSKMLYLQIDGYIIGGRSLLVC